MNKFILTARMDEASQTFFNKLRERHFPAERNHLPAHLTLFHALPDSELEQVDRDIREVISQDAALTGSARDLRSLGGGVAFVVECARLTAVRSTLVRAWHGFLTAQDRQTWRPHITVQNKVSSEQARSLLEALRGDFTGRLIEFHGFDLWLYEGGPWSLADLYTFADGARSDDG